MTKGVILFANNNDEIDYVRQAIFCAKQVQKYLKLPVSLVTDSAKHLKDNYPKLVDTFDQVISTKKITIFQRKTFRDGMGKAKKLPWNNLNRSDAYNLTPYDETIVMDTDYIVCNNNLSNCFKVNDDFMIWKDAFYLNPIGEPWEIRNVSDVSIEMYWATVFYFKKNKKTKTFFELLQYIKDNWAYYRWIYQIASVNFRNDFAFSIAIHIMNGFEENTNWPAKLPGTLYYTYDRDLVEDFVDNRFTFLCANPNEKGSYSIATAKDINVHIMNKIALERLIESQGI